MDDIQEIDTVLQQVHRAARRHRLPTEAPIAQQILLFGNSFYGYRFTTPDFTAVWSAADHGLKVFSANSQMLEDFPLSSYGEEASLEMSPSIGMTSFTPQLRAA